MKTFPFAWCSTSWRGMILGLALVVLSVGGFHAMSAADFTVLGTDGAWLQQNSRVTSGDVGANGVSPGPFLSDGVELTFGPGARVDTAASVVYGNRLSLNISAQVFDVHTNQVSGIGTILGQTISPLALPVVGILPPIPSITPGTQPVHVSPFTTQSLGPGSYGVVTVGSAGTLTLTGGTYELASLTVGNSAKVHIAAPTELRMAGRLKTDPIARIVPAPGTTLTAADILIVVAGQNGTTGGINESPRAVSFGQATTVRGKVWAPNGTMELQQNSVGTGAFLGKWVILGPGVFAHFEGGFGLTVGGAANTSPVAHAGFNQSVTVGETVELHGSGSTDADGDALPFAWSLISQPAGSTATLTTPTKVLPSLSIDHPGAYVVQLIVNDGTVDSDPDTVTLSTGNVAPHADAGPDQTGMVTQSVLLDGTASTDANGDGLTYQWTILTKPAGSTAVLNDPTSPTPSFTVDQTGTYTVNLVVSDGLLTSDPDTVIIDTTNSKPVSNAGPDHTVRAGTPVTLDGTGSADGDSDSLTYHWAKTVVPSGNTATLSDPTAAAPTLTPDVNGEYVVQLQVNDGLVTSEPDTALLRVGNTAPKANAGPDHTVQVGATVQLDGTNSSDPQSDPLTFHWTLTAPTGSTATLSDATVAQPTFVADVPGTYTATLLVNDGDLDSPPDSMMVFVTATSQPPTMSSFSPTTGPIGTVITITGQHFAPVLSDNHVTLNGQALVLSAGTSTSLTVTVPSGATTGALTVTTSEGTATSAAPFTITLRTNFTLHASPPLATAIQGGAGSYALTLSTDGDFTNLVNLSLANVPPTIIAHLTSPTISAQQTVFLTLSPTTSTPAGVVPITLIGTTQLETGPKTESLPLNLTVVAGAGQTHVSGQFLTADTEEPISNVVVNIGANQVSTDAAGRFLLQNVPAGLQKLMVSGTVPEGAFSYSSDLNLVAGQTHVLPPYYQTSAPPLTEFMPFNNATQPQVFTDARYPGLSFTLPAGVTVVGWDNQPKTGLAFEQVSLDRLGVPPPPVAVKSAYKPFFRNTTGVSAMGGFLTPPGSVIPFSLPNDLGLDPGDQAEMWVYDASPVDLSAPSGWKLAGMGTVSIDGTTITTNPGVGITRFCHECGTATCSCGGNPKCADPNKNPKGEKKGDPVDIGTGTFTADQVDLILPGRFPVSISRTFNPTDAFAPGVGSKFGGELKLNMGRGWVSTYDIALVPLGSSLVLVLPGNIRLTLALQPDGTWTNSTDEMLVGAVMRSLANGERELRFKEGLTWIFRLAHTFGDGTKVEMLRQQRDRQGNTLTIDRNGVVINRIVDASGRVFSVTSTSNGISQIQDPLGRTVSYSYDANRRLTTVTDPEGGTTHYTYDTQGNMLTITDARGIQYISNHYGGSGRVLRQVMADGGEWRYRYHLQGATVTGPGCPGLQCPLEESWETTQAGYIFTGGTICATTVVDPNGQTTTTRFNNRGYAIERIDGLGQTVTLDRGGSNLLTTNTDALGRKTTFAYDAKGNVLAITDPDNQVTRFEYEPTFSRVTKITDALNQITTFTYDGQGNLLTITDPLNHTTTLTYNAFGQPVTSTDSLGNQTVLAYDPHGNLLTTTDPLGNRTHRMYDAVSRLVALTDPRGFTTQYSYDNLNRVTQITDARQSLTGFTYDPNGNLLTVSDAKTQTTTYTYDTMDRLATRTDALNRQETYQYDPAGNLTAFTDRKSQQTTFQYDARHRRIGSTYADGTSTSFVYDTEGRLVRAEDSATGTIELTYDVLDRLTQETTPQGAVGYQYDALGRRTQMTANGQPAVTYQYDAASRLTRVAQGALFAALGYDAADRRTNLSYSNGTSAAYIYDLASRLTSITHSGPSGLIEALTYTYDPAGNRVGLIRTNGTASLLPVAVPSATYDAANQQLTFGGTTLTYDHNGNLTNDGINFYTWDSRDRLVGLSGESTANFAYDVFGRRVEKTVNGISTTFLYDGHDIVQEVGGSASMASYLRSLNVDEPFVRHGATDEFSHVDALGSPLALTTGSGSTSTSYNHEPFGKTTVTGSSPNALQFTGRENDGTGLTYYRARYYSPTLHRFLAEDPIEFAGGDLNLYVYVFNSPTNFMDPSGEVFFAPLIPPALHACEGRAQAFLRMHFRGVNPV